MPSKSGVHQSAQIAAMQYLRDKYREEYTAIYRAQVIANGGKVHSTKQEKIAQLKHKIAVLEGLVQE
jgi:hypothetical protein